MIVGSSAGGGYDLYGRLIARNIGKHIPGAPNVVVSNMPGAGSIVAMQYVSNVAAKDGTVMAAVFFGAVLEPLFGDKDKAKFDPRKMNFIGSANREGPICIARADAPAKTFAEALQKEMVVGASASGGSTRDFPALMKNVLGAKFKIVAGYPGSNEISLALEKGEIEGACGYGWSSLVAGRPQWLREHFVNILSQDGLTPVPALKERGVPLAISFAKTPEQRQIMELNYAPLEWGRPYVVAPEVPADRVAALRAAFAATMKDPDLLAEAKKINLDIDPTSGADVQALIAKVFQASPEMVEKAKRAIEVH
jgi:tripartite-type tricarboxylate transporter receptor subunit TctC